MHGHTCKQLSTHAKTPATFHTKTRSRLHRGSSSQSVGVEGQCKILFIELRRRKHYETVGTFVPCPVQKEITTLPHLTISSHCTTTSWPQNSCKYTDKYSNHHTYNIIHSLQIHHYITTLATTSTTIHLPQFPFTYPVPPRHNYHKQPVLVMLQIPPLKFTISSHSLTWNGVVYLWISSREFPWGWCWWMGRGRLVDGFIRSFVCGAVNVCIREQWVVVCYSSVGSNANKNKQADRHL